MSIINDILCISDTESITLEKNKEGGFEGFAVYFYGMYMYGATIILCSHMNSNTYM